MSVATDQSTCAGVSLAKFVYVDGEGRRAFGYFRTAMGERFYDAAGLPMERPAEFLAFKNYGGTIDPAETPDDGEGWVREMIARGMADDAVESPDDVKVGLYFGPISRS